VSQTDTQPGTCSLHSQQDMTKWPANCNAKATGISRECTRGRHHKQGTCFDKIRQKMNAHPILRWYTTSAANSVNYIWDKIVTFCRQKCFMLWILCVLMQVGFRCNLYIVNENAICMYTSLSIINKWKVSYKEKNIVSEFISYRMNTAWQYATDVRSILFRAAFKFWC
jgi:hypothetical protein